MMMVQIVCIIISALLASCGIGRSHLDDVAMFMIGGHDYDY